MSVNSWYQDREHGSDRDPIFDAVNDDVRDRWEIGDLAATPSLIPLSGGNGGERRKTGRTSSAKTKRPKISVQEQRFNKLPADARTRTLAILKRALAKNPGLNASDAVRLLWTQGRLKIDVAMVSEVTDSSKPTAPAKARRRRSRLETLDPNGERPAVTQPTSTPPVIACCPGPGSNPLPYRRTRRGNG